MNSLRKKIINRNVCNIIVQFQTLKTSTKEKPQVEIKIPMRIERGPTDILKALESTLTTDPTANDYRFMDDPFLNPTSDKRKRTYALSKESGKRAARFIIENHSDIFESEVSDPLIKAYLPPKKYTDKTQVSEEILMNLIKSGSIKNSLIVYELLEKNISLEAKQALFELLCFYNSEEQESSEEYPEELRYRSSVEINKNVWKDCPEIKNLFEELKNDIKTATAAYNAMICGTAKYRSNQQALEFYNECIIKKIPISCIAYNYLIRITPSTTKNDEERKLLVQKYLQEMIQSGIEFNAGTLNAVLAVTEKSIKNIEYSISIFSKFKSLGVEPTFGTYYYLLLNLFPMKENEKVNKSLFEEILNEIETREFTLKDEVDLYFFSQAMFIATKNYFPTNIGHRIYNIMKNKNEIFLGKHTQAIEFYSNYHVMVLNNEPLEKFVEFYDQFVPSSFIPDQELMKSIMESFLYARKDKNLLIFLTKFATHILTFEMLYNNNLIRLSLRAILKHNVSDGEPHVQKALADYAWKIWIHLQTLNQRVKYHVQLPAEVYGNIIILLIHGSELEKMHQVLDYVVTNPEGINGSLKQSDLDEIFSQCVNLNLTDASLLIIEYASQSGVGNVSSYVEGVSSRLTLDEEQNKRLNKLTGSQHS